MAASPPRRPPQPPEARIARAVRELTQATRELARRAEVPVPEALRITLPMHGPATERAAALLTVIESALQASRPAEDAWRMGRVWCYRCASGGCEHSAPPKDTCIFRGYEPTGRPIWADFVQTCVERRVPGLDELFADPPEAVAWPEVGDFTADVVPGYRGDPPPWAVLGQAVVGLVPADPGRPRDPDRRAFSAQVVALEHPGTPPRLRLNVLGLDVEALLDAAGAGPPRGAAEQLRRALVGARRQVRRLERRAATARARGEPFAVLELVRPIVTRLGADLCRLYAPRQWRTQHAAARHEGGARPTAAAVRDALDAGPERLFADEHRETIVVIGPRGRAHVFTADGRHVTSMRLEEGELSRKTARRRWRPLASAPALAFRAAVKDRG